MNDQQELRCILLMLAPSKSLEGRNPNVECKNRVFNRIFCNGRIRSVEIELVGIMKPSQALLAASE